MKLMYWCRPRRLKTKKKNIDSPAWRFVLNHFIIKLWKKSSVFRYRSTWFTMKDLTTGPAPASHETAFAASPELFAIPSAPAKTGARQRLPCRFGMATPSEAIGKVQNQRERILKKSPHMVDNLDQSLMIPKFFVLTCLLYYLHLRKCGWSKSMYLVRWLDHRIAPRLGTPAAGPSPPSGPNVGGRFSSSESRSSASRSRRSIARCSLVKYASMPVTEDIFTWYSWSAALTAGFVCAPSVAMLVYSPLVFAIATAAAVNGLVSFLPKFWTPVNPNTEM